MNFKKVLFALSMLIPFSFSLLFSEAVDVNHFLIAPSINGCGGFIANQSAYVLPANRYSLGLHQFMLKFNYGFMDFLEAGAYMDFGVPIDPNDKTPAILQVLRTGALNVKAKFLDEDEYFVTMAAGLEKLPFNLFENVPHGDFKLYAAASKKISDLDITLGVKKHLAEGSLSNWAFAADISKVVADTVLVMLEYDEYTFNAGAKISFNPNLSIDFSVRGIDRLSKAGEIGNFLRNYFVFGITYLQ